VLCLFPPCWQVQHIYACPGRREKIRGHSTCRVGDAGAVEAAVRTLPSTKHAALHVHISGCVAQL
jgi:hypothetical protein